MSYLRKFSVSFKNMRNLEGEFTPSIYYPVLSLKDKVEEVAGGNRFAMVTYLLLADDHSNLVWVHIDDVRFEHLDEG